MKNLSSHPYIRWHGHLLKPQKGNKWFLRGVDSTNLSKNFGFLPLLLSSGTKFPAEIWRFSGIRTTYNMMKDIETDFIFTEFDKAIRIEK